MCEFDIILGMIEISIYKYKYTDFLLIENFYFFFGICVENYIIYFCKHLGYEILFGLGGIFSIFIELINIITETKNL